MRLKENDEFILDIKRIGINGEGIGYYHKLAIFVDDAIPGEGHNVKITKVTDNMAFAESIENKHPSEFRQIPVCPYFKDCGACSTMHIQYDKMCDYKREMIIEAIRKYTKINPKSFEIKPTFKAPFTSNYRNRSITPLRSTDYNNVKACMIKEGTNHLIDIDECLIHDELINELTNKIIKIASSYKIPVYSAKNKDGILRYLSIRVNDNNEALVTFIVTKQTEDLYKLISETSIIKEVKGIYILLNNNFNSGNIIQGKFIHAYGEEKIVLNINKLKYNIYPDTFFQLNTSQTENLCEKVLKSLKLSLKEKVLDIYCGVGFISLYISHMAKEVVGIEYEKKSIISANENAEINKIKNTRFYCGDAAKVTEELLKNESFDCLILDPPRTGLDDNMIKLLLDNDFKRIIYVSCNPSTLAKNLNDLSNKYKINSIEPFDMLPNTAHIESITVLSLNKSN